MRDTDAGEIVNFHCRAAPSMSVIKVHENVDEIERALRRAFPTVKRVISHAEPPGARGIRNTGAFPFRTRRFASIFAGISESRFSVDKIYLH